MMLTGVLMIFIIRSAVTNGITFFEILFLVFLVVLFYSFSKSALTSDIPRYPYYRNTDRFL